MIALQWTSNAGYGFGNQLQSVIAANTAITGTGDGYGELGPSWDLQDAFTAAVTRSAVRDVSCWPMTPFPNCKKRQADISFLPASTNKACMQV